MNSLFALVSMFALAQPAFANPNEWVGVVGPGEGSLMLYGYAMTPAEKAKQQGWGTRVLLPDWAYSTGGFANAQKKIGNNAVGSSNLNSFYSQLERCWQAHQSDPSQCQQLMLNIQTHGSGMSWSFEGKDQFYSGDSAEKLRGLLKDLQDSGVKVAIVDGSCFSGASQVLGKYGCSISATNSMYPNTMDNQGAASELGRVLENPKAALKKSMAGDRITPEDLFLRAYGKQTATYDAYGGGKETSPRNPEMSGFVGMGDLNGYLEMSIQDDLLDRPESHCAGSPIDQAPFAQVISFAKSIREITDEAQESELNQLAKARYKKIVGGNLGDFKPLRDQYMSVSKKLVAKRKARAELSQSIAKQYPEGASYAWNPKAVSKNLGQLQKDIAELEKKTTRTEWESSSLVKKKKALSELKELQASGLIESRSKIEQESNVLQSQWIKAAQPLRFHAYMRQRVRLIEDQPDPSSLSPSDQATQAAMKRCLDFTLYPPPQ